MTIPQKGIDVCVLIWYHYPNVDDGSHTDFTLSTDLYRDRNGAKYNRETQATTPKEVAWMAGNATDKKRQDGRKLEAAKNSGANPRDIAKLQAAYDASEAEEHRQMGKK